MIVHIIKLDLLLKCKVGLVFLNLQYHSFHQQTKGGKNIFTYPHPGKY